MKRSIVLLIACIFIATFTTFSNASDPSPLQDFCVAVNDSKTAVFVNGKICKDPKRVVLDDFFYSGLNKPGNTSNPIGYVSTRVTVNQLPGLNTLGLTLVRKDFAPYGVTPPHTNPRASEILVVMKGTLNVGFLASNPTDPTNYKLFSKTLYPGEAYVFPQNLIHFQLNTGKTNAVAFAVHSSQNSGYYLIANAVFGSDPPINQTILAKAFQVDRKVIEYLQAKFRTPPF